MRSGMGATVERRHAAAPTIINPAKEPIMPTEESRSRNVLRERNLTDDHP
jgi:hypothetical protein